jgi:hypothetical protein
LRGRRETGFDAMLRLLFEVRVETLKLDPFRGLAFSVHRDC